MERKRLAQRLRRLKRFVLDWRRHKHMTPSYWSWSVRPWRKESIRPTFGRGSDGAATMRRGCR